MIFDNINSVVSSFHLNFAPISVTMNDPLLSRRLESNRNCSVFAQRHSMAVHFLHDSNQRAQNATKRVLLLELQDWRS